VVSETQFAFLSFKCCVSFLYLMSILNIYNVTFNLITGNPKCADHHKCTHINNDLAHEMWCPLSMCSPKYACPTGQRRVVTSSVLLSVDPDILAAVIMAWNLVIDKPIKVVFNNFAAHEIVEVSCRSLCTPIVPLYWSPGSCLRLSMSLHLWTISWVRISRM
jgi:hypothetical protein